MKKFLFLAARLNPRLEEMSNVEMRPQILLYNPRLEEMSNVEMRPQILL